MYNPVSTYRLQFNKDFRFRHAEKYMAYLANLGIGAIYASPILEARKGSMHGYDGINPCRIHPETGTLEQFKRLAGKLQKSNIGWVQDIVPNHMAYTPQNPWLFDILEKGPYSSYAHYFDTAMDRKNPIMVPFLGEEPETAIQNKNIVLLFEQGRFWLKVYQDKYPVNPGLYQAFLEQAFQKDDMDKIVGEIPKLTRRKSFYLSWEDFTHKLNKIDGNDLSQILSAVKDFNKDAAALLKFCNQQFYRLCFWKDSHHKINFRRFFTVNELICLKIERREVFDFYHQFLFSMVKEGMIQGLRIDHIDGLYDPQTYLMTLREQVGNEIYIAVEKILEFDEALPSGWPVQGTTGYGFLASVNNIFTHTKSEKRFTRFYRKIQKDIGSLEWQIKQRKKFILFHRMEGELNNLYTLFLKTIPKDIIATYELQEDELRQAIAALLVAFPVYRFYGNTMPLPEKEQIELVKIFDQINADSNLPENGLSLLRNALVNWPESHDENYRNPVSHFFKKMMQLCGPLMAKGVEDTLMYRYNRFIGHNEVGDSMEVFGLGIEGWHDRMFDRMKKHPLALNASSTHDTKRGEDVRARLNVLTDIPEIWFEQVKRWQQINAPLKPEGIPDANDEYFIYSTLAGMYPMPGTDDGDVVERLKMYFSKALREAKIHSSWNEPNQEYENGVLIFIEKILDKSSEFWASFSSFHTILADYGIVNSLAQLCLKCTAPGIPDIYQGTELWDLTLVDPDNRQKVDYELRWNWLKALAQQDTKDVLPDLWQNRYNGKIKLWFTQQLLQYRKQEIELFEKGQYIPLEVRGKYRKHILAYARNFKNKWVLVAVPLNLAKAFGFDEKLFTDFDWKDTRIMLPGHAPNTWTTPAGQSCVSLKNGFEIGVNEISKSFPCMVLQGTHQPSERRAGVLMHLTSLSGPYGIGDMGPEAMAFAEFLKRSGQSIWQVLPLNPIHAEGYFCPYESASAFAGNALLISPDILVKDGWLKENALINYQIENREKIDFSLVAQRKMDMLQQAYLTFQNVASPMQVEAFQDFCEREQGWLHDYALFVCLRDIHHGSPWYTWKNDFSLRNPESLRQVSKDNSDKLREIKWYQFIFFEQWKQLKSYCNTLGISLFGDIPFYVSYDSVDVWSHSNIFSLDHQGKASEVAGVPPDYFNENGQLWGMPVYNWKVLKENDYQWWINRIAKNVEWFDLVRLDHFRAFSEYWSVPAGEPTAKNGMWKTGPGIDFFKTLKKKMGRIPLIAEDLGDIDEKVHQLRKATGMHGMKVIQFAFGENMPKSENIPHNYTKDTFAYTGTHDNNTSVGWYRKDADIETRRRLRLYANENVRKRNVHKVFTRMIYASVSSTAIVPVQDLLGLDERARMNTPATTTDNWMWRMQDNMIDSTIETWLLELCKLYDRH
ncbi:MAG: malto-oligosyltrehalose synthase [Cyclobacteriaceae bacterium]|nr:malto-oligosyltrehalose synthase [Cyclobacteriaceae bacterium]